MANLDRLTAREVILVLIDGAEDDTLQGRTVVQKLCYFAGVALGEDLGHSPYYYGPFSREVEDGLEIAALAGQVQESTVRRQVGTRDVRQFHYVLTDEGREAVAALREKRSEEVEAVQTVLRSVEEAIPGLNQRPLSQAAKIHLILIQNNEPVDTDELPKMASRLGWQLTENDVESTVKLLEKLQLVEITP